MPPIEYVTIGARVCAISVEFPHNHSTKQLACFVRDALNNDLIEQLSNAYSPGNANSEGKDGEFTSIKYNIESPKPLEWIICKRTETSSLDGAEIVQVWDADPVRRRTVATYHVRLTNSNIPAQALNDMYLWIGECLKRCNI